MREKATCLSSSYLLVSLIEDPFPDYILSLSYCFPCTSVNLVLENNALPSKKKSISKELQVIIVQHHQSVEVSTQKIWNDHRHCNNQTLTPHSLIPPIRS